MSQDAALLPEQLQVLGYGGPKMNLEEIGGVKLEAQVRVGEDEGYALYLFEAEPERGDEYNYFVLLWDTVTGHVVARYGIQDKMDALVAIGWMMELADHPAIKDVISRREKIRRQQWEEMRKQRGPLSGWHYFPYNGAENEEVVVRYCGAEVVIRHNGYHTIGSQLADAMAMLVYPTSVIEATRDLLRHYERLHSDAVLHKDGQALLNGTWSFSNTVLAGWQKLLDTIKDGGVVTSDDLELARYAQWQFELALDRIMLMAKAVIWEGEGNTGFRPGESIAQVRKQMVVFQKLITNYLRRVACGEARADELPMSTRGLMDGTLSEIFTEIQHFECYINSREWDRETLMDLHMEALAASPDPRELARALSKALGTPY